MDCKWIGLFVVMATVYACAAPALEAVPSLITPRATYMASESKKLGIRPSYKQCLDAAGGVTLVTTAVRTTVVPSVLAVAC